MLHTDPFKNFPIITQTTLDIFPDEECDVTLFHISEEVAVSKNLPHRFLLQLNFGGSITGTNLYMPVLDENNPVIHLPSLRITFSEEVTQLAVRSSCYGCNYQTKQLATVDTVVTQSKYPIMSLPNSSPTYLCDNCFDRLSSSVSELTTDRFKEDILGANI